MNIENLIPEIHNSFSVVEKEKGNVLLIITLDKSHNAYLYCDEQVLHILELIDGSNSLLMIQEKLKAIHDIDLSVEALNDIIFKKLAKLTSDEVYRKPKNSYLLLKITLIKSKYVEFISKYLSFIFKNKNFVIFSFIFNIIFCIGFLYSGVHNFKLDSQKIYILPLTMAVTLLLHEFGHAISCRSYGAKHGDIGFGFYLLTPVLYADVTDVWKLSRKERVIVDIAGMYMESLLVLALIFLYIITGNPLFYYCSSVIVFNTLVNINPFLRFDGYWILSDITNTYNLRAKANEQLFKFISLKDVKLTANKAFLVVYGLLSNLFLLWFLYYVSKYMFVDLFKFPLNLYYYIKNWFWQTENHITFWQISLPLAFYFIVFSQVKSLSRYIKLKTKKA
jgi:putative peptide zinc metalloprotease protein